MTSAIHFTARLGTASLCGAAEPFPIQAALAESGINTGVAMTLVIPLSASG
jgi:hypothetical protein